MSFCEKEVIPTKGENYKDSAKQSLEEKVSKGKSVYLCNDEDVIYTDPFRFPDTWEDDITEYTFYFTYENGHPCLKVKFHAINEERINGHLVCIELKNVAYGRTGRYKAINAFEIIDGGTHPKQATQNITFIYMEDIEVGKEYTLYLKAFNTNAIHGLKTLWLIEKARFSDANPARLELDVRPSIRKIDGAAACRVQKNIPNFLRVSYLPDTEIA